MLISYNTELLRDICFRTSTAVKYLGKEGALCFQARHSDILAATSIRELLVGKVIVSGNTCKLEVPNLVSILLAPNYALLGDGEQYDWSTVARVKIMGINDVK